MLEDELTSIKARKIIWFHEKLFKPCMFHHSLCIIRLSLCSARSLSQTVHIMMKVWGYSVVVVAWVPALRLSAVRPTQNPVVPKGPWVFFLSLKAICWFQVYLLPLAVFSPVHRHSAQGELSSGGGESVCKRQCTAQEPNDRRCGVCGRRSTENVFVRLLFSGKNCRAQFINSAVTWCAHGMSQLGRK